MMLAAVGMVLLTQLELDSTYAANILPGLVITGLGVGLVMAPAFSAATSGVDAERRRRRLGRRQHVPADRRLDRHRAAEHLRRQRRDDYLAGKTPTPQNQALAAMESYTTVFWWSRGIFLLCALICGLLLRTGPLAVDPDAPPAMAH